MISMNSFGINGRLGNQLFQYAFLFSLSKFKGYQFCLPPNQNYYKKISKYSSSSSMFDCFELQNVKIQTTLLRKQQEKKLIFDTEFPNKYNDNTDYHGYFQSEKYFKTYKNELLDTLVFKKEHVDKLDLSINYNEVVSIHVRRGDYVNNSFHPTINLDYITNAKSFFSNKKFLVFSDDIDWCKKHNIGDIYADNNLDCVDLYQMSKCSSSIIANSSFSWWGAYLGNKKEKVIAPKNWFNGAINLDIYCEDWIII